jgi:hypothetical protein
MDVKKTNLDRQQTRRERLKARFLPAAPALGVDRVPHKTSNMKDRIRETSIL